MSAPVPTFRELVRTFARIGIQSFGGPAVQISVLHRVAVEEKRWVSEDRFLHALNFCMLLPGPEATQLATWIGWTTHGVRGGLAAGALFVLPGALVMLAISAAYALWREVPAIDGAVFGLKAAVLALVAQAVLRIARRSLRSAAAVGTAVGAFLAIWAFRVPFPAVVAAAAALGFVAGRVRPGAFGAAEDVPPVARPSWAATLRTAAAGLALWLVPVAAIVALAPGTVFAEQATWFSGAAVVTFGGAYAVLAWVQQDAVARYGWVTHAQMADGLGLAETTPGPLILVLQFVAFLGAFARPEGLPPLAAGLCGAAIMLWATFTPCFLWIFALAPWVEAARGARSLASALGAVTAAAVGVIANLGAGLVTHTMFTRTDTWAAGPVRIEVPVWSAADPRALAVAALAALLLFAFRRGLGLTLAACVAAGMAARTL